jgi:hypothetical protein
MDSDGHKKTGADGNRNRSMKKAEKIQLTNCLIL